MLVLAAPPPKPTELALKVKWHPLLLFAIKIGVLPKIPALEATAFCIVYLPLDCVRLKTFPCLCTSIARSGIFLPASKDAATEGRSENCVANLVPLAVDIALNTAIA